MPILRHNNFGNDTINLRRTRLQTIQAQHRDTLPLLNSLPNDLKEWMQHCSKQYESLIVSSAVQQGLYSSSNERLRLSRNNLRKMMRVVRMHVLSFYNEDEVRRGAFGVERALRRSDAALLERAEHVLSIANAHREEGVEYRLPDAVHQRLADATAAFAAHRQQRGLSNSDAGGARTTEDLCYRKDTQRLRRLLAFWQGLYGNNDVRIVSIGMVNNSGKGKSGHPGMVSLSYDAEAGLLNCAPDTARPKATSYHLQFRLTDSSEWQDYAKAASPSFSADRQLLPNNSYVFRARARNAHGFGKWSEELMVGFEG